MLSGMLPPRTRSTNPSWVRKGGERGGLLVRAPEALQYPGTQRRRIDNNNEPKKGMIHMILGDPLMEILGKFRSRMGGGWRVSRSPRKRADLPTLLSVLDPRICKCHSSAQ